MTVAVVSTGRNAPTKHLCTASVQMQLGGPYEHVYIESPPERTVLQNIYEVIHQIHPECIVAWLDGDDALFRADALMIVQRYYMQNPECLLTFGQFVDDRGRPGFAQRYTTTDYRSAPWLATHLKTFKAGLFHKIKKEDLMWQQGGSLMVEGDGDPRWIPMASDQAVMIPLLELAGPNRHQFIQEPLVLYNMSNSHHANADEAGRLEEQMWAARVRTKPRYGRLP